MLKILSVSTLALTAIHAMAACPDVAGKDAGGKYPHLFEKKEFESRYHCQLQYHQNPAIGELNARIAGNPKLKPLAQRLPQDPLIIAPYQEIGRYGGVLRGISKATEAGTSDLLSVRHVNLVRFNDDLQTIVPDVAKSWHWNKNYTVLTMKLRKGHKWSDGKPFTAHDIVFWYNNLILDANITKKPKERFLSAGKPMKVEALDDQTIRFTLNAPKPGLLTNFALDYAQPFQPRHLLAQFDPALNKNADKLAKSLGFKDGYTLMKFYYGQSDWKDIPTPLLKDNAAAKRLVKAGYTAILPTLEAYIVVEDTPDYRHLVANPYFFQVDTAGHQLPYINEIHESYISDEDIQTTKIISGDVDYKTQAMNLPKTPVLLENKAKGNYQVALRPTIGMTTFAFNLTDKDKEKRTLFNKVDFRRAMSIAINRNRINKIAYFGLGKPMQYTAFDPDTAPFVTEAQKTAWTKFDPARAKKMLDQIGFTDKNGDGVRDLPSGKPLTLEFKYSTQGVATKVVELIAADWTNIGVKTTLKEVTSDEYRNSQTANNLDLMLWKMGRPLAALASDTQTLVPPYGSFFDLRTGMLWAQYRDSNGKSGIKPPATVDAMQKLADQFVTYKLGSEQSNRIGRKIVQRVVDDLFIIGTVKAVKPIIHRNTLVNFEVPKTWASDYYWAYPYLPTQWFLDPGRKAPKKQ
jgi:peptide/nickel transport system substrate-binding protein